MRRSNIITIALWMSCLLLSHGLIPVETCSRDLSRKAESIIIQKFGQSTANNLSENCQFNPKRGLYWLQEQRSQINRFSKVRCLICGKEFTNQTFLDKHFDNRHEEWLNEQNPICLAEYCSFLNCENVAHFNALICSTPRKANHLLQKCLKIAKSCFTSSGSEIDHELEAVSRTFCEQLECQSLPVLESSKPLAFYISVLIFLLLLIALSIMLARQFVALYTKHYNISNLTESKRLIRAKVKKDSFVPSNARLSDESFSKKSQHIRFRDTASKQNDNFSDRDDWQA